jgi:hypothetical protein
MLDKELQQARQHGRTDEHRGIEQPLEFPCDDPVNLAGILCLVRFRAVHATLKYPWRAVR